MNIQRESARNVFTSGKLSLLFFFLPLRSLTPDSRQEELAGEDDSRTTLKLCKLLFFVGLYYWNRFVWGSLAKVGAPSCSNTYKLYVRRPFVVVGKMKIIDSSKRSNTTDSLLLWKGINLFPGIVWRNVCPSLILPKQKAPLNHEWAKPGGQVHRLFKWVRIIALEEGQNESYVPRWQAGATTGKWQVGKVLDSLAYIIQTAMTNIFQVHLKIMEKSSALDIPPIIYAAFFLQHITFL